jgi:hypothetical protein
MMQPAFQEFQRAFARHLRDPHHVARPAGLPERRTAVYRELVFNNLCGFVDRCFPVCRSVLGEARWRRLCRTFVRDWPLHTPWFREIPREFVRYLAEARIVQPLPAWFAELAHYEWAELAMDISDAPLPAVDPAGDLMARPVVLNPALMHLACAWPVQRIGPDYRPRKQQPTQLLVYRTAEGDVCFSEINPVTARLLALLADGVTSGSDAIVRLADELQHPDPERLLDFGRQLLADLREQGVILGVTP